MATVSDTCRYCEHLKDVSRPRGKFIGMCEFRMHPDTCGRFELAKCYEGHDPRTEVNDGSLEDIVSYYRSCPLPDGDLPGESPVCRECRLNRPAYEHCEHPTYCELLADIENSYPNGM